ncbi:1746_t:CDS:2, partial [Racocetra persica]
QSFCWRNKKRSFDNQFSNTDIGHTVSFMVRHNFNISNNIRFSYKYLLPTNESEDYPPDG